MRIAFHAPLKPPGHPVPSGDRLMARQLLAALRSAGHDVTVATELRTFLRDPDDHAAAAVIARDAGAELDRLAAAWTVVGAPDLWFCYHPYYKSPDRIGPGLCRRFGLPYVTAESSYSARRNIGLWMAQQDMVRAGLAQAAMNICLTDRDRAGILAAVPGARTAMLFPFVDPEPFRPAAAAGSGQPLRLATIAMMRPGDKLDSYRLLAATLAALPADLDWRIAIAGDGPARGEVATLLAPLPAGRVHLLGALDRAGIAGLLANADLHLWPGAGEAYGLAYLEAAAAALPSVAMQTAGVPAVVTDGVTGLLCPPGDAAALAAAVTRLARDPSLRAQMAAAARARVVERHSPAAAAATLAALLAPLAPKGTP
jgi:glycosyltransferase involved in cell wall biosynthesis